MEKGLIKDRKITLIISVVSLVLMLVITVFFTYYFTQPSPPGRPELVFIDIKAIPDNNSVFITIENFGGRIGIIMNITQIELANSTNILNPIDVISNELLSYEFPIAIDIGETLNLTCIFGSLITISTSYTLSIYYNAGRVIKFSFF